MRTLMVAAILFSLTGCSTLATYRGDHSSNYEFDQGTEVVLQGIIEYANRSNISIVTRSPNNKFVRMRYQFPGTQTWAAASRVLTPYAEPIGRGRFLANPYGKNPFVTITASLTQKIDSKTNVLIDARWETYGEPRGKGGVGPFQMNSNGTWEHNFINQVRIESSKVAARIGTETSTPPVEPTPSIKPYPSDQPYPELWPNLVFEHLN